VTVKLDWQVWEDQGDTLTFRWMDGETCVTGSAHDFTASSFVLEWLDYRANTVTFETASGSIAGGPPLPAPAANVAVVLTPASLAGHAGLYRLRLIEDPAGARNVFRRDNLPVVRINPAPTGP
jgi:hypothetical protein